MRLTEGTLALTPSPREQALGELLEVSGAGNVYAVPKTRPQLAKIYSDSIDVAHYERKIAAMLDGPPNLPDVEDGDKRLVQIAWPEAALRDGQGRFVGFLMPAIDLEATHPLEWILQERQARAAGLMLGLAARMRLAANIAATLDALHDKGHRVVDLTPGKLRFHAQSLTSALLACDSFSIQGTHARFPAQYASTGHPTADYLAPEFHEQPIPPEGEQAQDFFALAVLVFQLLNFGIHPFTGIPAHDAVPTDIQGRIAARCYAYGAIAHPAMQPSPVSGHLAMPEALRSMFDRAFSYDGRVGEGSTRPSADEWAMLLTTYAMPWNKLLQPCSSTAGHQHFVDLPCAECARAGLIVSIANASDMSLVHVRDPMAPGVHPFVAPQSVEDILPVATEWHATMPINMPLPLEDQPPRGLPKRVVIGIQIAAVLALVALGLKLGFAYKDRFAAQTPLSQRYLAEPADAPGAPRPDPDMLGFPSMEKEEALTESYARPAALAIARGDRVTWENAMSVLRSKIPPHQGSRPNAHQAEFATFAASVTPQSYNERERQILIDDLHQSLLDDPFDDEAAFELGWLSLIGAQRGEARQYYLHALWVNPDRANAWYGYGVVARDDAQAAGALATAEVLETDPTQAQRMRDAFPPLLLRLCSIKPERFAILQRKARRIAEQVRAATPPPASVSEQRSCGCCRTAAQISDLHSAWHMAPVRMAPVFGRRCQWMRLK